MAKKDEKAVVTEASVEENTVKEDVAAKKPTALDPEELVSLEIPIRENEEDDWFCSINGETFQIQRGVAVKVPRKVKEIYDNEKRMNEESIRRSRALQERLMNKERNLAFR
jgi:hypothetical protein